MSLSGSRDPPPRAMEATNLSVAATGVALPQGSEACSMGPSPSGVVGSTTAGDSALPGREPPFSVFTVLVVTLLVLLIAATFLWNLLVLVTILRVRAFHRVPHNLVASTAVSDVLVAALVMPLSLVSELSAGRRWRLGRSLCHVWISFDVLCCTASIWNVAAIALDRYWTITRHLQYTLRTRRRASALMIALTWALSALIALAPLLFGWGEAYDARRQRCQVSQEPSYAVFSTCGAFYLPLGVVLFVYWKIYKAAKFRFGRRRRAVLPLPAPVQVRSRLPNRGSRGRSGLGPRENRRRKLAPSGRAPGAHGEFVICSPGARTRGASPAHLRSPGALTEGRARGGGRGCGPGAPGKGFHQARTRPGGGRGGRGCTPPKGACRGSVPGRVEGKIHEPRPWCFPQGWRCPYDSGSRPLPGPEETERDCGSLGECPAEFHIPGVSFSAVPWSTLCKLETDLELCRPAPCQRGSECKI